MSKVTISLVFSLLAGSAFAQADGRPAAAASHVSAGTDATRPASAASHVSAGTDAPLQKAPAAAAAASHVSAGTDAPKSLIPKARTDKQPAATTPAK